MATCRDWLSIDLGHGPRRVAVERYAAAWGDADEVTVARAPARVSFNNHVDHQGAPLLYACHGREVVAVVGYRDFGAYLDIDPVAESSGSWQYVEAGIAAVGITPSEMHHRVALAGDIPTGAGQASSSAVVVAVALACGGQPGAALADACARAERGVGTKGGAGDHLALLCGPQDGSLLEVRQDSGSPVLSAVPWPAGYTVFLADSQVRARKAGDQLGAFNSRVDLADEAARRLGVERLGQLTTERYPLGDLYNRLLSLPEHPPDLRGAAVYVLARADRGLVQADLLRAGTREAMREFGRLLSIAHDGDRVTSTPGSTEPDGWHLTDEALRLAQAARTPLRYLRGAWGASTPAVDELADLARSTRGCLGASIMGAGHGGTVVIVCEAAAAEHVADRLAAGWYWPRGKTPSIEPWRPTGPAAVLEWPGGAR